MTGGTIVRENTYRLRGNIGCRHLLGSQNRRYEQKGEVLHHRFEAIPW